MHYLFPLAVEEHGDIIVYTEPRPVLELLPFNCQCVSKGARPVPHTSKQVPLETTKELQEDKRWQNDGLVVGEMDECVRERQDVHHPEVSQSTLVVCAEGTR